MKTSKYFDQLDQIRRNYPELTFDNKGYETLRPDVIEDHQEQIAKIEEILKKLIPGFDRFDNFKPRKDGSFSVRFQYDYNHDNDGIPFIGVGYIPMINIAIYENNV